MQKLLIIDGIGGVPLGREMHEAFCENKVDAAYYDLAELEKIRWYGFRSGMAKLINRADKASSFFHLPKLAINDFTALLERERPTHVLIIGFVYKFIAPNILTRLKNEYGFSLYLYDTDSCNLYSKRREFIFFLDQELPIYERIFSFSKVTTRFFKETRCLNAEHFPFGAKPLPYEKCSKSNDVTFIGSSDLRRIFLLENIRGKVAIYGNRWERNYPLISTELQSSIVDEPMWGDALYQRLRESKIVLNITRTNFYGAETGINLRIFEALSLGCFLLTDYCDEIAELFEVGVEIEVFRSAAELKEKVTYYLNHPEQREAIAKRGYEKFIKQYTWELRAAALADNMHITAK